MISLVSAVSGQNQQTANQLETGPPVGNLSLEASLSAPISTAIQIASTAWATEKKTINAYMLSERFKEEEKWLTGEMKHFLLYYTEVHQSLKHVCYVCFYQALFHS